MDEPSVHDARGEPGNRTLQIVSLRREQNEVSTSEAAAALDVTERTVRRAIARGDLAAIKRGTAYRIRRQDLMRYAARHGRRDRARLRCWQ